MADRYPRPNSPSPQSFPARGERVRSSRRSIHLNLKSAKKYADMNFIDLIATPFRYRPWRPRHAKLIAADLSHPAYEPIKDHDTHLRATLAWLCLAQDVRRDRSDAGGVAAGWSFEDGWLPSYPETTGYIIETFIAAADYLADDGYRQRANQMLDWELGLQAKDGSFPGHFGESGSHPVIFNQGQIMHGLIAGYVHLRRDDCLNAAVRAANWLAEHQDLDGCYRTFEHHGVPHVYNTRAVWALASVGALVNDRRFIAAAVKNLDWALTQQTASGWFATNAFVPSRQPFTHTIAYAIRGLLESGVILSREPYLASAKRAALALLNCQRSDGWLAGTYADEWRPGATYACVTGVAQMALCWLRLHQIERDDRFLDAAHKAIAYVKRTQRLDTPDSIIRGAIPGSSPIWGDYSRFEFPNWAAKFFADALLMDLTETAIPVVAARVTP